MRSDMLCCSHLMFWLYFEFNMFGSLTCNMEIPPHNTQHKPPSCSHPFAISKTTNYSIMADLEEKITMVGHGLFILVWFLLFIFDARSVDLTHYAMLTQSLKFTYFRPTSACKKCLVICKYRHDEALFI